MKQNKKILWALLEDLLGNSFDTQKSVFTDIVNLSQNLTEGREDLSPNYLKDAKHQRAYLAYYLPQNYYKFLLLFNHHQLTEQLAKHPQGTPLKIVDFGAGPGTASLALLSYLAQAPNAISKAATLSADVEKKPVPIQFYLIDHERALHGVAKKALMLLANRLNLHIEIKAYEKFSDILPQSYDVALIGNVLNELKNTDIADAIWQQTTGQMIVVEPSHRVSSQKLIRWRERLLSHVKQEPHHAPTRIVGPCTHAGNCPLFRSKHWCHFSQPLNGGFLDDRRLVSLGQRALKSSRQWLKFSYLYISRTTGFARQQSEATSEQPSVYRAIGDLHPSGPQHLSIDLCRPDTKEVFRLPRGVSDEVKDMLIRGAVIKNPPLAEKDLRKLEKKIRVLKMDEEFSKS